jgi:hypothetical protein
MPAGMKTLCQNISTQVFTSDLQTVFESRSSERIITNGKKSTSSHDSAIFPSEASLNLMSIKRLYPTRCIQSVMHQSSNCPLLLYQRFTD